jgi:hypothetical protein
LEKLDRRADVAQSVAQVVEPALGAQRVGLQFENLGAAARVESFQLMQVDWPLT